MSRKQFAWALCLLAVAALAAGCSGGGRASAGNLATIRNKARSNMAPKDREALLQPRRLSSIGEMATIEGLEALPCIGFGLVTGLDGKGADESSVPKEIRDQVIKSLISEEGMSVNEAARHVWSRDSSIVFVSGSIPAGAPLGSTFDAVVEARDPAVSLEGGYLRTTQLRKFVSKKRGVIPGSIIAKASGPLTVGAEGAGMMASSGDVRRGRVFDGGKYIEERGFIIRLGKRYASSERAVLMEYLLNNRLFNVGRRPGEAGMYYATALNSRSVMLRIPSLYREQAKRFGDLVKSIEGSYYYGAPPESRMEQLSRQLANGSREEKYQASVVLEGIGSVAAPYIESAVEGADDWTLLHAATALANLESAEAGDLLLRAAESEDEGVRQEAVSLLARMSGRRSVQALRAAMYDQSRAVAATAIRALGTREDAARLLHFARFDIVAVGGVEPGLVVLPSGRPTVAIGGLGTKLTGTIEIQMDRFGIGSIDEDQLGVVVGEGADSTTHTVDATIENLLVTVGRYNPSFEVIRKIIEQVEDAGNLPYGVTWLE